MSDRCSPPLSKNNANLSNTSHPRLSFSCPFRRECFRKLSKAGKGSALRPRGEENLCGRGGFSSLPPFLAREWAEQGKLLKNRRSGWSLDRKHRIPHTPRPAFQGPPVFPSFNSQTQLRAWQRERPVMSNDTGQHRRIIAVRQPSGGGGSAHFGFLTCIKAWKDCHTNAIMRKYAPGGTNQSK